MRIDDEGVLDFFAARGVSLEPDGYIWYHHRRYAELLTTVTGWETDGSLLSILDVGPGFQTQLLRALPPEGRVVDTLGYRSEWSGDDPPGDRHVDFNLNDAYFPERWVAPEGEYDLVIAAEVIEHLYTSPVDVFTFLATFLKPGGRLLVQTPNACAAIKRWHMLKGRYPFPLVRQRDNAPHHFREYSRDELIQCGEEAGLMLEEVRMRNYFASDRFKHRFLAAITEWLPGGLRAGITMVYRKP